ncbi:hypothetical protein ig2599ANME_0875 [groundwater metagenome]
MMSVDINAKSYNIMNIVTNDSDFEKVEWLRVRKP